MALSSDEIKRGLAVMAMHGFPQDHQLQWLCRNLLSLTFERKLTERDVAHDRQAVEKRHFGQLANADRKFLKFLEDRTAIEKLRSLLSDEDYEGMARAIVPLLSGLKSLTTKLERPDANVLAQQFRFFGSKCGHATATLLTHFQSCFEFLSVPIKSKFRSAREAPRAIYNRMVSDPNTIAFEYADVIYIFADRLAAFPAGSFSETILHETLHLFIIERHQRPGGKDPAYAHEKQFLTLPTQAALENPDSYVEFFKALSLI
jgi:hypothetical protein